MREHVGSIEQEFLRYKKLAEGAFGQVDDRDLCVATPGFNNSIATLVWHISGNLKSRFTDFLTSDGEKPWRGREGEFAAREVTRQELLDKWEDGWRALAASLAELSDDQLGRSVVIRGFPLTVAQALHRSLAHAAYHVGQIVYIAKAARGDDWHFMSIPPGKSEEYNRNPTRR
jgi:Protein of unknown function (DUF1572)